MNRSVYLLFSFVLLHTALMGQAHYFEKFFDYQTWGDAFFSVLQDDSVTVAVGGTAANSFKIHGRLAIVNNQGKTLYDRVYKYNKYPIFELADIVRQKSNYYFTGYGYLYVDTLNYFIIRGQFLFGKTDKAGNILLLKDYGDTATTENALDMVKLSDNKFLLTGYKLYNDSFKYRPPYEQIILVCVDSLGNLLWQSEYGSKNWEVGRSSVVTPDGGFLTVGLRQYDSIIDDDILLVKFDSLGQAQWEKTYGDSLMDGADRIISCLDGSYLICGYYNQFYSDYYGKSIFKAWVLKIDSSGNVIWEKKIGDEGPFIGQIYSILQLRDSSYWLAGSYTKGSSKDKAWLIHLSNTGDVLQNITLAKDTLHHSYLWGIDIASNGDLILAGETYNDSTYYDAWLLRVDSNGCQTPYCLPVYNTGPSGVSSLVYENPTGINTAEKGGHSFSIYPNPSTGRITISLPSGTFGMAASLRVYDITGRAVLRKEYTNLSTPTLTINLAGNPAGLYMIELQTGKRSWYGKVMLE